MHGRRTDVSAKLDRQLLERKDPPAHALAREQLTKAGIKVKVGAGGIIRANPESILFVNEFGRVMTAWSEVRSPSGAVVFYCETGMPAWPSGASSA